MKPATHFLELLRKQAEAKGMKILRIAVGLIYCWFGLLKFLPQASPAEDIASQTIHFISFGQIPKDVSMPVLGAFELFIGLGFLFKIVNRVVPLMYLQMAGTMIPLVAFREQTWSYFPLMPTMLGQYIIKNIVFIAAAIILGAVSRGAHLVTDPQVAQKAKSAEAEKKETPEK